MTGPMTGFLAPMLRRLYRPKAPMPLHDHHHQAPGDPGVTIIGALHASIDEHERIAGAEATRYERSLRETMAALDDVFREMEPRRNG